MKKNTPKLILLTLLLWAGNFASNMAFSSSRVQKVMPTQSYWVVETNQKQRDYSIVRFYNQQNELLYEERLNGIYLNISRPKHVKRLNLALQEFTEESWAGVKQLNGENQKKVVAGIFRR